MKKIISLLLLCAMACAGSLAQAAGVTIATFTPFADMDFAAQGYMDLITQWESETGNFVKDYSGVVDEAWLAQLKDMAATGEADVVIVPTGSGLTADELVTAKELAAAAPQLGAKEFFSLTEADGSVLLTPVRINWEALYVNTDVLAANGLGLPSTLEELATVCAQLSAKGVVPIANALADWSEIALDCAALMGAPNALYGGQESLSGAQDALTMLAAVGAFGGDAWTATDADMMEKFLCGEAAMRFDSDFLAYDVPESRAGVVTVIAPPTRGGAATSLIVGTPSFGLAITRSCFEDEARREAALSLCEKMLSSEALVSPAGGMLGAGVAQMTRQAGDCTGLLYDANPDGFDSWAQGVVAALMQL